MEEPALRLDVAADSSAGATGEFSRVFSFPAVCVDWEGVVDAELVFCFDEHDTPANVKVDANAMTVKIRLVICPPSQVFNSDLLNPKRDRSPTFKLEAFAKHMLDRRHLPERKSLYWLGLCFFF